MRGEKEKYHAAACPRRGCPHPDRGFDGISMGAATERDQTGLGISRADQDAFAAESHARAAAAIKDGRLAEEIVPVTVPARKGAVTVDTDGGVRPGTTADKLAALPPAFSPGGNITAGSASQLSDGACAVVVMSSERAAELGLPWLAEIGAYGTVAGPDPSLLLQPANAIRNALRRDGTLDVGDLDLIEINEAFAAVAPASMRDLGVPGDKVNVNGGAIALGHPIGMSGARLALTLALELRRRGGGTGAAALCGGGGQGDALVLRVPQAVARKSVISQMAAPLVMVAPACAVRPATVPDLWAFTGCSIFIASRTRIRSPAATCCPSETATLMTVPCIGAARTLPEAPPAPGCLAARWRRGWPPRAPGEWRRRTARVAGSVTSRRLPSTSTTTVCLSAGPAGPSVPASSAFQGGRSLRNSVSIHRVCTVNGPGLAVQFGGEGGVGDDGPVERQGGGQPADLELGQGPGGALQCLLAGGAGDDELAEQRVPGGADHRARLHAGVEPDAGPGGRLPGGDGAGRGQEAAAGVLGVDPELDRVAARARVAGGAVGHCRAARRRRCGTSRGPGRCR